MKRKAVVISIVMLLLSTATQLLNAQAHPDEASVRNAVTKYDNAWNKKDVNGVSAMLAADYAYFSSTGSLTNRKATLDFLASPDYKLTSAERSEIEVISLSTSVAIVSSRWKGRGSFGKELINDDQRCGLVFVRISRRWKLLSEHCAQIVSK